jgi:hypothetical protein
MKIPPNVRAVAVQSVFKIYVPDGSLKTIVAQNPIEHGATADLDC